MYSLPELGAPNSASTSFRVVTNFKRVHHSICFFWNPTSNKLVNAIAINTFTTILFNDSARSEYYHDKCWRRACLPMCRQVRPFLLGGMRHYLREICLQNRGDAIVRQWWFEPYREMFRSRKVVLLSYLLDHKK